MKINILGVLIDNFKKTGVLQKIEQFLSDGRQHYIVTPNPEMVMAAQKDKKFLEILNRADLAAPDGVGLIFASRYLKRPLSERITGVDLMFDICRLAEHKNCSVYFLGSEEGVAEETARTLAARYPRLRVAGAESGGVVEVSSIKYKVSSIVERINYAKPDILFVALGAERQEKFIANNLNKMPTVKIAMGVGGAFDFIAGKVKRAPVWMRKIGMEWLWRLFIQPWRWKRILTATVKFSWEIIWKGNKYEK